MPIAAMLVLLERYGPAAVVLIKRHGPTVLAMLRRAAADGTLERDLAEIGSGAQRLAPLLGAVRSLAELSDALHDLAGAIDLRPAQPEDPAMARAAGRSHKA